MFDCKPLRYGWISSKWYTESLTIMEKGSTSSTHGSSLKQPPTGTTAVQKQTSKHRINCYVNVATYCWATLRGACLSQQDRWPDTLMLHNWLPGPLLVSSSPTTPPLYKDTDTDTQTHTQWSSLIQNVLNLNQPVLSVRMSVGSFQKHHFDILQDITHTL